MRRGLPLALLCCAGVGSSSCTLLFGALTPPACEEGPPQCLGDALVRCEGGFELEEDCAPGFCEIGPEGARCQDGDPPLCGNGVLESSEECDDANTSNGDGCDAQCVDELCGDGIDNDGNSEECDDGNNVDGDGCSANCTLNNGRCGDSVLDPGEECDDGNTQNNDGCSSLCALEIRDVFESESNDNTPNDVGEPPMRIHTTINGPGDQDHFRITLPRRADLRMEIFDETGVACDGIDPFLELFENDFNTSIAFDDDSGVGACPLLDSASNAAIAGLDAGQYIIFADGLLEGGDSDYMILVTFNALCGDGVLEGSEACDDGNATNGDGCDECAP